MTKYLLTICLPVLLIGNMGCIAGPHAQNGTIMGTLVGAPIGAVIGSKNGEPGAGALIGGALGAFTGNRLGANIDTQNQQEYYNQRVARRLAMNDVIAMTRNGLAEDVIIAQIATQGINIMPTTDELIALKNSGVSDRVIQAVQNAVPLRQNYQQPVIVEEHYWGPIAPPIYHPYGRPYGRYRRPYCDAPPRRRHGSSITFSHRF